MSVLSSGFGHFRRDENVSRHGWRGFGFTFSERRASRVLLEGGLEIHKNKTKAA